MARRAAFDPTKYKKYRNQNNRMYKDMKKKKIVLIICVSPMARRAAFDLTKIYDGKDFRQYKLQILDFRQQNPKESNLHFMNPQLRFLVLFSCEIRSKKYTLIPHICFFDLKLRCIALLLDETKMTDV